MDLGLEGKVVIVTGGARGIGKAIVEGFIEEGANVIVADIMLDTEQESSERAEGSEVKVLAVMTNVTKKSDVDHLVSATLKRFGKIDILVNSAAVVRSIKFVDIEEEEWDRVSDVNVKGVYLVTRAVVPHMIAARHGKIINISSVSGKEGVVGLSHYCASKFAIIGITQTLAKELAEYDINVNAVCPGIVRTQMWEVLLDDMSKYEKLSQGQIFDRLIGSIPLRRAQTTEDIANTVLFLSSEASKNITGEAISVNGGMRMD